MSDLTVDDLEILLTRLRELATAIALNPSMDTKHGETADLAYDAIMQLRQRMGVP